MSRGVFKCRKKLKSNSNILCAMIYGSLVNGDIWEKSDIDFFVITKEQNKNEIIQTRYANIKINIQYVSRDIFIEEYNNYLKGGTFHKAVFSGKILFCLDNELMMVLNEIKFYTDRERNIRNIEILSNLLNSIHYVNKYLITHKYETAYQWCVDLIKYYARLLMSVKGHMTDKDILSFAVNMDLSVKDMFDELTEGGDIKQRVEKVLRMAEDFIEDNIEVLCTPIIEVLKTTQRPLSVQEIRSLPLFKQIDGDLSKVLNKLAEKGIINEITRKYTTYGEEYLIDEIVYTA
ncbi:nucleotidyltransferase domain-containing protein [Caloramator sp. mosi_1]|nr:nucleotidyltransferase domain-containing protein [Caloramator sp. mosi_1]WDC85789.1 nucleotidyltransferase domain-containing protein [Caloramator sp. mosi_1]